MTTVTITASDGSTIIAPVNIGSTIEGGIKIIQNSQADPEIKSQVEMLLKQIAEISS